jgi:NAD(P)-dependent dehydrogenase (short-subunit alcohol dehydrogenase family)
MKNSLFSLHGHVALVTGASSGIGYTVAKGLANAGARVIVAARRIDRLDKLVNEIAENEGQAFAVAMDVADRESVDAAYELAHNQFGVVDIIINNAGVTAPKNFLKINVNDRDSVMNTNFNGVWNVAQEGARRMTAAKTAGSIVNVSSYLGLTAQAGLATYCASKGAVIQLTRVMALDLARYSIRVNALAPGWFKTEMNNDFFESDRGKLYIESMPAGRVGDLEELIGPIIFLASDAGSFVNGSVLTVDGAIHVVGQ